MSEITGIALAGGKGVRARPLTLEGPGYLRSKATVPFIGRPLIEWQINSFHQQGVENFYIAANGRENRYQVKDALGYGETLGVRVQYSRARADRWNTGSGQATLSVAEEWNLKGLAVVFPTDSLFEFDLAELVEGHVRSGALVTVATVHRQAREVAGTYGTMVADDDGWIREFVEKPPLQVVNAMVADPSRVPISTGLYVIDCRRLRELAATPALAALARLRLDWGRDLLPWLVSNDHPVRHSPITKVGDLGNPRDYLTTLVDALSGGYPSLRGTGTLTIHPSSLARRDEVSGMTLAAKIASGLVKIGPNVWIGRDVEIGPGVVMRDSYVGDGVDLHAWCHLERVACLDGAIIGPAARLVDTHVGMMACVESSLQAVTTLDGYTALGHEAIVQEGTRLTGVTVDPRLTVRSGDDVPAGTQLTTVGDLVD
ncbi:NDP-sugar synthase [Sphaerisporangium sp. NPDC051017]|uniref:NDP-sugar synthase n=1 Tax=Sphaerisporangium sp. NPDC051017 TaxID=3154636 RepID=UPI003430B66D